MKAPELCEECRKAATEWLEPSAEDFAHLEDLLREMDARLHASGAYRNLRRCMPLYKEEAR